MSKKIDGLSKEAIAALMNYNWPGNVRELENVIERSIILCKGPVIVPADFPENLASNLDSQSLEEGLKLKEALKSPEKDLIIKALDSVSWNRNDAARTLDINRTTLYKKMHKYGLLKGKKDK